MNNTWKRLAALVLTAVMVLGLAVSAGATDENEAAAAAITDTTLTITGVAAGDTVNAYRLIGYTDNSYNDYLFDNAFDTFVSGKNNTGKSNEAFLETSDANALKDLLASYAMNGTLPAVYKTETSTVDRVSFTLAPGYYLFVGQTTANNSKLYQVMSAFVQVKQGQVHVYAGDGKTELAGNTIEAKSANGPTIDKKVYDSRVQNVDDLGSVWKTAAAARRFCFTCRFPSPFALSMTSSTSSSGGILSRFFPSFDHADRHQRRRAERGLLRRRRAGR